MFIVITNVISFAQVRMSRHTRMSNEEDEI